LLLKVVAIFAFHYIKLFFTTSLHHQCFQYVQRVHEKKNFIFIFDHNNLRFGENKAINNFNKMMLKK